MKLLSLVVGALLAVSSDAQIGVALLPVNAVLTTIDAAEQAVAGMLRSVCSTAKNTLGVTYAQLANTAPAAIANIQLTIYKTVPPATVPTTTIVPLSTAGTVLQTTASFDRTKSTIIYIHGFIFGPVLSGVSAVTTALAATGTHNVMAVDASGSINVDFFTATTYVQYIGKVLGAQLAILKTAVPIMTFQLIGHGLGAHLASSASTQYTTDITLKINRITGLDPLGPCFEGEGNFHLTPADAIYVDVIHSDAGNFGFINNTGVSDFFPNGGSNQPSAVGPIPLLSHVRAWEMYVQSVYNSTIFPAVQCSSYGTFLAKSCTNNVPNKMGVDAIPIPGQFYLRTGASLPLGLGTAGYDLTITAPTPAVPFPYNFLPEGPLIMDLLALWTEFQALIKQ